MDKISFKELISLAWQNTIQVLFRPYSLKKCVWMFIIVIFAGNFGGMNFNFNMSSGGDGSMNAPTMPGGRSPVEFIKDIGAELLANPRFLMLMGITIAAFVVSILLWVFIRAIFQFVFIEAIVRNDASVKIPFNRNKELGISYFYWNLAFGLIATTIVLGILAVPVGVMYSAGVFTGISKITAGGVIGPIVISVIVLVIVFLAISLIRAFALDFIPVIMYSKGVKVREAWRIFRGIFARHKGKVVVYLLVKFCLAILCIIAAVVIMVLCAIVMVLCVLLAGLIGYLVFMITPVDARMVATAILIATAAPVFFILALILGSFLAPIPVFLKSFAMYFLAEIDDTLNAFLQVPEPEEEDAGLYEKPLTALWTTLGVTIISVGLLIFTVIYGGAAVATSGSITAFLKDAKTSTAADMAVVSREPDVVYLKNGGILEGIIIQEDTDTLTLQVKGGTFSLGKQNIESVERGAEKTSE
ncbi:MAG: hypothetical protein P9L88_02970 [Candidatus Tantalella remota]|nr:hypothetical protein [Candidatus Tantalella remota]